MKGRRANTPSFAIRLSPCIVLHLSKCVIFGSFYAIRVNTHDKPAIKVCSYLKVMAGLRNGKSEEWARLLLSKDPDGVEHPFVMPMSMLAGDGNIIREHLLSLGLELGDHKSTKDLLIHYIQSERPKERARCVTRVGWHGEAFVLPSCSFGRSEERVFFQAAFDHEFTLNAAGTLEEWQKEVANRCRGNSRLIFALSTAFAPPLLLLTGDEKGGFHFQGDSSIGKTTTLRVAGSVCGGGGGGMSGYIQRWRATSNGIESIAEAHCDLLLPLDELAQVDPR